MPRDDAPGGIHLTILPPRPTLEEIEEFIVRVTGRPMTPEDRAETQRKLGELADLAGASSTKDAAEALPAVAGDGKKGSRDD